MQVDAALATTPTNAVIDALLVKITGTELVIQDLQSAIDGDGNGEGQLSAPQHKQASKHLLNRQRKIISQCQQLDKLQSACMFRHTKANRKVISPPHSLHQDTHTYIATLSSSSLLLFPVFEFT